MAKSTGRVARSAAEAAVGGGLPGVPSIKLAASLEPLLVPITDVVPDPANPRRAVNLDVLKGSFMRFGVRKPIVANSRTRLIEAGHQTREVLLAMGATHVPVVWVEDNALEATAYNIADNRTAEIVAEWDEEALARLVAQLNDEGATDGIGFTPQQIEGIVSSFVDHDVSVGSDLPSTPFDDRSEADLGLARRIIIVFDDDVQKADLERRLGASIEKVLYHYKELCSTEAH